MILLVDIGADEVSCEEETYHENDWTYDGTINIEEFAILSAAWYSHDPNDPALDPNSIEYDPDLSDPNNPSYVDQYDKLRWNSKCNLDKDGDSEYAIDLADFVMFLYDWLWRACWYDDYSVVMYGQSYTGGGEQMMMSIPIPTPESGMLSEQPAQTETAIPSPFVIPVEAGIQSLPVETEAVVEAPDLSAIAEKSIAEQILDLQDAIAFLEQIWLEDDQIHDVIQSADWQAFVDSVYQCLTDLQAENAQTE